MTVWTPINQGQITSNDPEGPNSCVAYSFAYALADATNGRVHPTGEQIRNWTGDHLGGLELAECDRAVAGHLGIDFRTDVFSAAEFYGKLASGFGAVLLIGYGPIGASKFDGSPGFVRNHAIYVPPGLAVMDPLADGRRPGIYRYKGEAYPKALLNAAAAALVTGSPPHQRHAGPDHFEASLIHLEAAPTAARWKAAVGAGHFWDYQAIATTRTIHGRDNRRTGGFSGECTPPVRFIWPGIGSYTLVRMLTGSRGDETLGKGHGKWIAKGASHITVREV